MKIFNEEEVDNAACEYSKECGNLGFERTDFTAGVEYAESKVEDLCMEFAEYYYDNCDENPNYEFQFNKFLKERE